MKKENISMLVLLLFCSSVYSEISHKINTDILHDEIDFLMATITRSECIFNRNGTDYAGHEAVTHINTKYDYFKSEINTAEDFISYAATKSEFSGRKYTVTCKGEEPANLGQWLLDILLKSRN